MDYSFQICIAICVKFFPEMVKFKHFVFDIVNLLYTLEISDFICEIKRQNLNSHVKPI